MIGATDTILSNLTDNTTNITGVSGDGITEGPILDEEGNIICTIIHEAEYLFYGTFS